MSNQITAYFKGRTGVAEPVYQNDYGMVLHFDGIYLPANFDCYFSIFGSDTAIPGVGADNRVAIPNTVLSHEGKVTVHIPLHTGSDDSEVEYVVYFNVIGRARPVDDGTPEQQTAISEAIALLNSKTAQIPEDLQNYYDSHIAPTITDDVSSWLDAHPEATTTVEDGSLTEAKFSEALKVKTVKDYVTPEMFGAKGDGETDDTEAIQAAFDASHFIYFPDGEYLINGNNDGWGHITEGGVFPQSNTRIVLSNNAKLKAKANSSGFYNVLNLNNVDNVTVTGGKIQGEKLIHIGSTGEFGYGIRVSECNKVVIDNVEIYDCWGDAVMISSADEVTGDCDNIIVQNCLLHDCRRQGISVVVGTNIKMLNNTIYNISGTAPQSGIDLESSGTQNVENILISGCSIFDSAGASIICNTLCKNVIISNCLLTSVNAYAGENILISDSILEKNVTLRSKNVEVKNCKMQKVAVTGGCTAIMDGCYMENDSGEALTLTNDNPTEITKAIFKNCDFVTTGANIHCIFNTLPSKPDLFFDNCRFDSAYRFMNYFTNGPFKMVNCDLTFEGSYQVFTINNGAVLDVTMIGCVFNITSGTITYLFSSDSPENGSLYLVGNKFENYTHLLYNGQSASGKIVYCNNILNSVTNPTNVVVAASNYDVKSNNNFSIS